MLLCALAFHAQSGETCAGWNRFSQFCSFLLALKMLRVLPRLPYRFETL